MFGLGFQEIVLIFVVALLIFGANKLPTIGKALGQSIKEFKKAFDGNSSEGNSEGKGGDGADKK